MADWNEIIEGVESLSASCPEVSDNGGYWFKPERGSPNYFRYVDGDGESRYDVYLETDVSRSWGLDVKAKVCLYDVKGCHMVDEEEIFDFHFNDYHPEEQAFINNIIHYQHRVEEAVQRQAETAVHFVTEYENQKNSNRREGGDTYV
jgi:hypothetical protein